MILERIEELYIIFCLKIGRVIGVATDKVAHFFCCFMASIILGFMFSIETGVIAAIAMGVGKDMVILAPLSIGGVGGTYSQTLWVLW